MRSRAMHFLKNLKQEYFEVIQMKMYSIGLKLSLIPNKIIEYKNTNLGTIYIVKLGKKTHLRRGKKYFSSAEGELKLGKEKGVFLFQENFLGTQLVTNELCITAKKGNLVLDKCCDDIEFCSAYQSFNITYFDEKELSNLYDSEDDDLVDRFQMKYSSINDLENEVIEKIND